MTRMRNPPDEDRKLPIDASRVGFEHDEGLVGQIGRHPCGPDAVRERRSMNVVRAYQANATGPQNDTVSIDPSTHFRTTGGEDRTANDTDDVPPLLPIRR